jgi:hypothetical protein
MDVCHCLCKLGRCVGRLGGEIVSKVILSPKTYRILQGKLLASHEAVGSAPLALYVSLVSRRLHPAVHSGTQRALIVRFMSRANTCTHTNAHPPPLPPLSVPCTCTHVRPTPRWRGHAHLLVLSHSCTASSPSSRGPLPAGGDGPTDRPKRPYHQPLSRRHYARNRGEREPMRESGGPACPRAGPRVASRPTRESLFQRWTRG